MVSEVLGTLVNPAGPCLMTPEGTMDLNGILGIVYLDISIYI